MSAVGRRRLVMTARARSMARKATSPTPNAGRNQPTTIAEATTATAVAGPTRRIHPAGVRARTPDRAAVAAMPPHPVAEHGDADQPGSDQHQQQLIEQAEQETHMTADAPVGQLRDRE